MLILCLGERIHSSTTRSCTWCTAALARPRWYDCVLVCTEGTFAAVATHLPPRRARCPQLDKRGGTLDEKIAKLDAELVKHKEQIQRARPGPAQARSSLSLQLTRAAPYTCPLVFDNFAAASPCLSLPFFVAVEHTYLSCIAVYSFLRKQDCRAAH